MALITVHLILTLSGLPYKCYDDRFQFLHRGERNKEIPSLMCDNVMIFKRYAVNKTHLISLKNSLFL